MFALTFLHARNGASSLARSFLEAHVCPNSRSSIHTYNCCRPGEGAVAFMENAHESLNVYHARVRSHQTDLNAAMYHGAYLDLFDDARIETFRRLGYTYERMLAGNWGVFIRTVHCDFHAPAFMDDLISVLVCIPRLTTATMTARYECRRGDVLLAVGENTYVFVDGSRKPLRVPHDLRALIDLHCDLLSPSK